MQHHPRACRLAAEAVHPERLFLSALLHDIGKVFGGREHSERGADMVRSILQRFAMDGDDIEHVAKLVLLHLNMYFVAARRDLADPNTIEQFAAQVGDLDCLRDLYVLTVADISTTAPTSMTTWKSRMLDELYGATAEHLSGSNARSTLARARAQLLEQTRDLVAPEALEELLHNLPDRYLLSNTPQEIAAHAQVVQDSRGKRLHLALVPSRHEGVAELCVVTGAAADNGGFGDRPGLLATIAAALTACKLEILAAQIYTRTGGPAEQRVLDVFWVRDRVNRHDGVTAQLPQLERTLDELLSGTLTFEDVLRKRNQNRWSERPAPPVATEISIDDTSSSKYTIIEVIAQDRAGLLFNLANALYELRLSIEFAKVNTEGNRVIDIFYVTELDETKIGSRERAQQIMQKLRAAV
jgi:[protein-PII] uridylyltransferase